MALFRIKSEVRIVYASGAGTSSLMDSLTYIILCLMFSDEMCICFCNFCKVIAVYLIVHKISKSTLVIL